MAYGMKIGQIYVMRNGKMLPIQRGLLKMRPEFMSKASQSKALKEARREARKEDSSKQSPSEELKDSKETK